MRRVEFRLSMPGVASWNGRWTGEGRNYSIVRKMSDTRAKELLAGKESRSWFHRWDDGWCAQVFARIVAGGERLPKSDGFCGYEWMVSNILLYDDTREPKVESGADANSAQQTQAGSAVATAQIA